MWRIVLIAGAALATVVVGVTMGGRISGQPRHARLPVVQVLPVADQPCRPWTMRRLTHCHQDI